MGYCTNCRAPLPPGADTCPACGVYAGDVFEGRIRTSGERRGASGWIIGVILLVITAVGGGGWWYLQRPKIPRPDTGPVRVVGDRPGGAWRAPGAAISEPEAILTLRHDFAAQPEPMKADCLAVMSRGYTNGDYTFDVVDSCSRTRLGRWRVNARTRAVSR